jgi:hypothetical protein
VGLDRIQRPGPVGVTGCQAGGDGVGQGDGLGAQQRREMRGDEPDHQARQQVFGGVAGAFVASGGGGQHSGGDEGEDEHGVDHPHRPAGQGLHLRQDGDVRADQQAVGDDREQGVETVEDGRGDPSDEVVEQFRGVPQPVHRCISPRRCP